MNFQVKNPIRPVTEGDRAARDLRAIRIGVTIIAIFAVLAVSVAASDLVVPTAVAIILALVLTPVVHALERCRLPPGLAALLAVGATACCLAMMIISLTPSFNDWVARAPEIVSSVEQKLKPFKQQLAAVEKASQQISRVGATQPAGATKAVAAAPPSDVLVSLAKTAPALLAKALYATVMTIFLLACRRQYNMQLILFPRRMGDRLRMARVCRDVRKRVAGYFLTLTIINVGLACATAICFWLAGLPDPVLWGVCFGVLNFIPIIGPTTGILLCLVVGFASEPTIVKAFVGPAILLGLNTIEANFVQPWLLSRRLVLSPIAIFTTVATLVWMWGAPAAITAVPILVLLHTIVQHVPSLNRVAPFLARGDDDTLNRRRFIHRRYPILKHALPDAQ